MRAAGTLRVTLIALALGAVASTAHACLSVPASSAEEAAQRRQDKIDYLADRFVGMSIDAELIFIGRVTAIRTTGMAEALGGPIRLGWQEDPSVRVWLEPTQSSRGVVPPVFSIYEGRWGDTCGSASPYWEGGLALVAAERRYEAGHWFGEIIGEKDLPDLFPALVKRGLNIEMPVR